MKVSDYIANKIKKLNIPIVPVFQGGAIMHIIDSIGNLKGLNYYCPYHEQSLAMSVDAYSRLKGFGVGCVTSGPGATNLITGVCCSYYDSIPCLFFTGQVGQFHIKKKISHRQKGFQETDVKNLFSSITKFSYQIKNVDEVDYIIDKAIYIAKSGRPGPVVLDVPYNIQVSNINFKKLKKFTPPKKIKIKKKTDDIFKLLIKKIKNSKRPIFISGGGITLSKSNKGFLQFVKKLNIPFLTSWNSQDICTYDNRLYFGSVGRHGNQSANEILDKADLVVTFGFRFAPKAINENFGKNRNVNIIALDIDKTELNECIVRLDKKIQIDFKDFFKSIKNKKINKINKFNWLSECKKIKNEKFLNNLKDIGKKKLINPYLFFHKLSFLVKNDSKIFTDAGANLCWCLESYKITKSQKLISAWGNSPMGYSISAGIGACFAEPKKQIISSIGDGSFMINVQEMQFLKHHPEIILKIIIFDNQTLGNTKLGTQDAFNGRTHANDKENGYFSPDIERIVKSFDIKYFNVKKNSQIESKIKLFLKYKKTCVLHVSVSSEHNVIDHSKKYLNSIYKW